MIIYRPLLSISIYLISSTCNPRSRIFGKLLILGKQSSRLNSLHNLEYQCLSRGLSVDGSHHLDLDHLYYMKGVTQSIWISPGDAIDLFNEHQLPIPSVESKFELLSHSKDPYELIDSVKKLNIIHQDYSWQLDNTLIKPFVRKEIVNADNNLGSDRRISLKSLLCTLSQQISGYHSFSMGDVSTTYTVFETEEGYLFSRRIDSPSDDALSAWKSRPFLFSSASNIMMTESISNILIHLVCVNQNCSVGDVTLLDPCCGSGTMGISALR